MRESSSLMCSIFEAKYHTIEGLQELNELKPRLNKRSLFFPSYIHTCMHTYIYTPHVPSLCEIVRSTLVPRVEPLVPRAPPVWNRPFHATPLRGTARSTRAPRVEPPVPHDFIWISCGSIWILLDFHWISFDVLWIRFDFI